MSETAADRLLDLLGALGMEPSWCNLDAARAPFAARQPTEGPAHAKLLAWLRQFETGLQKLGWTPPADRDAAVLQGFADCESLVVAMLTALADAERQKYHDAREEDGAGFSAAEHHNDRANALREAALAVTLGQHRDERHDPDELRQAHARAAVKPGMQSAGGKARAPALTPKQRSKQASRAIKARWDKARGGKADG